MRAFFENFFTGLFVGSLFGLVPGMIIFITIGASLSDNNWEKECVNRGVAEYNQITGEWQWKIQPLDAQKEPEGG